MDCVCDIPQDREWGRHTIIFIIVYLWYVANVFTFTQCLFLFLQTYTHSTLRVSTRNYERDSFMVICFSFSLMIKRSGKDSTPGFVCSRLWWCHVDSFFKEDILHVLRFIHCKLFSWSLNAPKQADRIVLLTSCCSVLLLNEYHATLLCSRET